MEQPALAQKVAPSVSVVSSTPFPASTAAMEDPRMSKARVEKLKRRIIRAVAAKLSQNADEDEMNSMWLMMKKICKCDCKLLWKHMRAVTVKKLKRLLSADDRVDDVTAIARLTITDWLLYDLVLVHENIDVIGQDIWGKTGEEPEPLVELFFLIVEYQIEELEGTELIEGWLNLTREYNESGRKCSPMLLQRRWYQLKEATRKAFYLFWCHFRGNATHFQKAAQYKPTALQVDIAKKYKELILTSFPDWNEMIEKKKVVLAHEFDNHITLMRQTTKTDTEPDLQVVEVKIDTIDIEDDSDDEMSNDVPPPHVNANETIECETEIDLTSVNDKDIHFLKQMNIPCETPFANYDEPSLVIDCGEVFSSAESRDANDVYQSLATDEVLENSLDDDDILVETNDINLKMSAMMEGSNKLDAFNRRHSNFDLNVGIEDSDAVYGESNIPCDDSSDSDVTEITDIFNPSQIKIETPFFTASDTDRFGHMKYSVENAIEDSVVNDKVKGDQKNVGIVYEEDISKSSDINQGKESFHVLPKIQSVTSINSDFSSTEVTVRNLLAQKATELEQSRFESSKNNDFSNGLVIKKITKSIEDGAVNDIELLGNFDEIPKNLQFVDDGIVLDDEDENVINAKEKTYSEDLSSENESSKIDLKLLLFSTVYTKKLDQMDVFRFIDFDNIRDKRIIECAEIESKPKDLHAVNLEDIYLPKNKDLSVKRETNSSDQENNPKSTVHQCNVKEANIIVKTEYSSNEDTNNDEDHPSYVFEHHSKENEISSDEDDESLLIRKNRVNVHSNMFKKPRVRNYNPIQLCKNPDFNTRLKRLTAGFLSYEKNREYLKQCHPVTIDLNKSFELKLNDSTMYLDLNEVEKNTNKTKPNETQESYVKGAEQNTNETKASSEVEELKSCNENISFDTKDNNVNTNVITSIPTLCKRNKVINLPDITVVRRVNKNIVTAEVAPLQMNTSSDGKTVNERLLNYKNDVTSTATSTVSESNPEKQICIDIDPIIVKEPISINKAGCVERDEVDRNTSKNNKNATKQKTQQKRPYNHSYGRYFTPWNRPGTLLKEEECLLASDTVDKMLALFSGHAITTNYIATIKKGIKKKSRSKKYKEKCKEDQKAPECTQINSKNNENTDLTEDALAVLSISQKKKKKVFCCWAQKKILYPNLKRKHPCKRPLCKCCCKYKLLEKYKTNSTFAQSQQQPPTKKTGKAAGLPLSDEEVPNQTAALSSSDEEVLNKTAALIISDEEVPNQTSDLPISDEEVLIQLPQEKHHVNIPTAAERPPSQPIHSVPSIVIDGNTKKINVPKFIVRHQTQRVTKKAIKQPNISNTPTGIPNIDILPSLVPISGSVETNTINPPIHENRLRIKTNLTNTKNTKTKSNLNEQHPPSSVLFERTGSKEGKVTKSRPRMNFSKMIANMPASLLEKASTNTVKFKVKKGDLSSASPIFLGKNKILLSTVRGPMAKPIPIDPPKIILPEGVEFILLPNNELALAIAPGVGLAVDELRHLELVIQALQKVLGIPEVRENDLVSDCNKTIIDNKEAPDEDGENIVSTNNETILNNEINLSINESPETLNAIEDGQNTNLAESVTDVELKKGSVTKNAEKPTTDTNRKTILSDLMEMSGISAEDAKLPEPSTTPPAEENIPHELEMHPDLLRLFNNPVAVAALANRPDLSILTTYSDVRYASDNNGKFFKMDVCTGVIAPINVFIKKKDQNKKKAKPVHNHELIDLTSDKDDCSESDDNNKVTSLRKDSFMPALQGAYSNKEVPNKDGDGIKPLKLFRAMHSSILNRTDTSMDTNIRVTAGSMVVGNNVLKVVNLSRRKQNLKQCLKLDMSDVTGDLKAETSSINLDVGSDSDDEPLAKKANRQSEDEINRVINSENTKDAVEGRKMSMDEDLDDHSVVYEEIETEFEPYEDAVEDCILGV